MQKYSPNETINVKGDGNCLFRCFARIIFGNEGEHNKVRSQICDEFEKNQGISNLLSRKEKLNYIKEQGMRSNGTWGTEIEILCATALLKCSIFVFDWTKNQWLEFNIRDDHNYRWENEKVKKNIFLSLRNQHFTIVKNVKEKMERDVVNKLDQEKKGKDLKGGAIHENTSIRIDENEI